MKESDLNMTKEEFDALDDGELAKLTLDLIHTERMKGLAKSAVIQRNVRRGECILFLQQGERASNTTMDNAEIAARKLRGA